MQTATADPLVGRALEGRYRIRERIARGGMSTVYAAVDERLDRLVAVKVMNDALSADPAFSDRFAREARSAAKLTHVNVVSVYDQGEDVTDDRRGARIVFLVMELVSGRTLRELLRERGPLSPAEAVSIMEPVLLALSAAHRAGLVHRDVKPENILLADDGTVKVADFGLARAVETDASSTRTGLMMGTVAYCPPEQITRGRNDQRSDVYSAGIVLFELLTGRTPFTGGSAMEVAYRHVHERVPAPSSLVGGIPPQLDELVARATDREPGGRPLDAGALLAELTDVRNDLALPVTAVPARRRERPHPGYPAAPPARAAEAPRRFDPARTADLTGQPTGRIAPHAEPDRHDTIVDRPAPAGPPRAGGVPPAGPPPPVVIPPGRDAAARRSRRRRRGLVVLLVVLLLGAAVGYGSWWFASGRYGTVPQVDGQSIAAATDRLQQAGYKVDGTSTQYSEDVASGSVIGTDPASGAHRVRGTDVVMVVSLGKERFTMPAVVGQPESAARSMLGAIPVALGADTFASSDTVAKGSVISVVPGAGTQVRRGQAVTLQISTGLPQILVTSEIGKSQDQATSDLQGAGFQVSATQAYSDTVPQGQVISQTPDGGTAPKFSTVAIVVSLGPPLVTIPRIAPGTDADTAKQQLEALGLKVKEQRTFGGPLHEFIAMDPSAGTSVLKGSTVTVYVV